LLSSKSDQIHSSVSYYHYYRTNSLAIGQILFFHQSFANDIDNVGGGYIVVGVEEVDGSTVFPIKGIRQNLSRRREVLA
jgi:hypothetical protein